MAPKQACLPDASTFQVADPTYMLPALAGLSFLAPVERGAADGMEGQVRLGQLGRGLVNQEADAP